MPVLLKNERSIITFSRRTDPAFFMDWFMDKVGKGGCYVPNPFSGIPYFISLKPEHVVLLSFWTRNPLVITPYIKQLAEKYSIAFFVTHTNYPRWLECNVPLYDIIKQGIHCIADMLSPDALWWRYDPILFTRAIDRYWHVENFTRLCEDYKGKTTRVITSLAHIEGSYRTAGDKLRRACKDHGDILSMPSYDQFIELMIELKHIARRHGMNLEVCCSPQIAEKDRESVKQGQCLSPDYIKHIVPELPLLKKKGTRKECPCLESRDIGSIGTCRHGCVYCYANRSGLCSGTIRPGSPWLSADELPPEYKKEQDY